MLTIFGLSQVLILRNNELLRDTPEDSVPFPIGKNYRYGSSCHTTAMRNGLLAASLVGTIKPLPPALVCFLSVLEA